MNENLKPGPIQTKWLQNLRDFPDRQLKDTLGIGDARKYKACCLFELNLCFYRAKKKKLPFDEDRGYSLHKDGMKNFSILSAKVSKSVGLRSGDGTSDSVKFKWLAVLNDSYMTWPEIADHVEENFEHYFTKSV